MRTSNQRYSLQPPKLICIDNKRGDFTKRTSLPAASTQIRKEGPENRAKNDERHMKPGQKRRKTRQNRGLTWEN